MNKRIEYSRAYQDTAYLQMIQEIFADGFKVMDRTGTGTIGINGYQAVYDMSRHARYQDNGDLVVDNFPLLTTKKMATKAIIVELLWFLRGETNIRPLVLEGVNIWNDWPLKYYTQINGTDRIDTDHVITNMQDFVEAIKKDEKFAAKWGELGPVYGKQWRFWENYIPTYPDPDTVRFVNRPIDQLTQMVDQLKNNKFSRRIIVMAWNPADIEEMAKSGLPPCHMEFQAFVRPNPEDEARPYIDLQMYQRSCDSFLGVPFNIASYSLLLCLLAKETGYLPGKFIHQMGSVHIYLNHIEQMQEQLTREPFRSPTLTISANDEPKTILETEANSVCAYQLSDFSITNYTSHGTLKGAIAV